jgi:hypothetical protein
MNIKRALLLAAMLNVIGMIFVGSATAASETRETRWYINGAGLAGGQGENVKCSIGEHPAGEKKLVLTGEIGEGPKIPIKLTATGLACVNHEGTVGGNGTARIIQTGPPWAAEDLQRWHFTGVTVSEPARCAVEGGTILTNPLKSEVYHDVANPAIIFKKFEPTTGPTGTVATVKIVNSEGNLCPLAGNRVVKGSVFGEFELHTGVEAVNQPLTFSLAVDETAGSTLSFAGNPAHVTGTVNTELAGANAGKVWGSKPK